MSGNYSFLHQILERLKVGVLLSILLIIISAIGSSCKNEQQPQNTKTPTIFKKRNRLIQFTNDFTNQNRGSMQNNEMLNQTNIKFKDSLLHLYQEQNVLEDLPFMFEHINEYSKGKYIALFEMQNVDIYHSKKIFLK